MPSRCQKYLCKSENPGEIRMKTDETFQIGASQFDPAALTLKDDSGQTVPLRHQSAEVLRYLLQHRSEAVSKHEILNAVWPGRHVTDASLVQCIKDIREALGANDRALVETLPRRGYRLNDSSQPSRTSTAERPILLVRLFSVPEGGDPELAVLVNRTMVNYLSRYLELAVHPMANAEAEGHFALEGAIQWQGDRVRVWVQLLDCLDGACLRSEVIELADSDPFTSHDRIARSVAATFGDYLSYAPFTGDRLAPTCALRFCFAARAAMRRNTEPDLRRAEYLYRETLRIDPTSPCGLIGLGFVFVNYFMNGWGDLSRADALCRAREKAEIALSTAPFHPGAHVCRAKVHLYEGMLDAATLRLRHALELNPTSPAIRHQLGKALVLSGEASAALSLFEETFAMASIQAEWPYGFMALALWANHRVSDALDMSLKRTELPPHDLPALAVFQVEAGKRTDARRTILSLIEHDPTWCIGTDYLSNAIQDRLLLNRYRKALGIAGAAE